VGNYVLRRVSLLIPTLVGMSVLIFLMLRLLPGDVVDALLSGSDQQSDPVSKQELRHALGLSDPLPVQYLHWVGNLLRGNFGTSLRSGESVSKALLRALPITLELAGFAILIAVLVAIPLGVLSAVRRDTYLDFGARVTGLIGLSIPNFWIATLILLVTSKMFHWVPPIIYVNPLHDPLGNIEQMILPAAAIAVQMMAIIMRMTRTTMLEVLNQDYIRTARAKGLRNRIVVYRHALRNALIPVITVIGFQLGALMGGSAIMEVIFGLNGLGNTIVQAIFNRDYPLVQTAVLFLAAVFVVINLVVDVLYAYIDPRIRVG
jgi:peptide/nickel transport system permease protein